MFVASARKHGSGSVARLRFPAGSPGFRAAGSGHRPRIRWKVTWSEVSDLGAAVGTGAAGDVLVAKERLSSEISASATRWVFVLLSSRAALKACLARKMESWTLRRAALSDAAMAAFVDAVGGLRGFGSVGGGASGR